MDISLLFALVLLNGFFAMSEIALVASRKPRLQYLADNGDKSARAAMELGEHPTRFLSTLQIGITAIGVLNGIIGEATLAEPFSLWLEDMGVPPRASEIGATALVVVVITYVTIILGELVPKRLGQISPEAIARRVARPILLLAAIAKPFVRLLAGSTELVLRLMGVGSTKAQTLTEDEIHAILAEGSEAGVIDAQEGAMLRNVFRLDDRQVLSLMTPRSDIVFLDVEAPIDESLRKIGESEHSRYPVCRGDLTDILGVATAKGLLGQSIRGEKPNLQADLLPAVYVPESLNGMELLENFRSSNVQFVLVVDEYGEVQGLVTLQDVFEAIIGEFKPMTPEDAWAIQREDGSWLLDGLIPIPELKDRLHVRTVPEEDKGRYHTLSGMVMLLAGKVPRTGDKIEWEGWHFEIVDMDGTRIDKVLATPIVVAADELLERTPAEDDGPGS
ncbi:MAG TPA: hemolysin family protein [Burkholderiales bacterium]|nr:HlyC/CorC family transporter [Betaproteobacteria bacterium]HQR53926.1 hemolysin family protein [Burkholderiales bacterium]